MTCSLLTKSLGPKLPADLMMSYSLMDSIGTAGLNGRGKLNTTDVTCRATGESVVSCSCGDVTIDATPVGLGNCKLAGSVIAESAPDNLDGSTVGEHVKPNETLAKCMASCDG